MRRTRRRKYTWLPIDGTPSDISANISTTKQFVLDITTVDPVLGVTTLTFDQNQELPSGAGAMASHTPLNDLMGEEYFLKRIVGKVFVNHQVEPVSQTFSSATPAAIVTAGFFIARQDFNVVTQPQGFAIEPLTFNPTSTVVIREPWIWRRSWILGWVDRVGFPVGSDASGYIHDAAEPGTTFPPSNVDYGSVLDGPHIDARTARRVRQEERLFFVCTAQTYPIGATPQLTEGATQQVRVGVDVRLLGALRKTRNRGTF